MVRRFSELSRKTTEELRAMVLLGGGRVVPTPTAGWYEVFPRAYLPKYVTERAAMQEWLVHREDES